MKGSSLVKNLDIQIFHVRGPEIVKKIMVNIKTFFLIFIFLNGNSLSKISFSMGVKLSPREQNWFFGSQKLS